LIVAALTGLTLSVCRVRDAAFRHACWRLVLIAMIAMPVLTVVLPAIELPFLPAAPAQPTASTSVTFGTSASLPPGPSPVPIVAVLYGFVAFVFVGRWMVGYLLGRQLIRSARPATIDPARVQPRVKCLTSNRVTVPLTFGWIRPVVLLPATFHQWRVGKLCAVLAHETAHIRRRDFQTASVAALSKAIFWFHPLAWWLDWRLATLAEQAADDAAAGANPEAYAGVLVNIARDARDGRLHGLAVAGRKGLEERVARLLDPDYTHAQTPRHRIVLAGAVLIVLSGLSASVVITEANAPERAIVTGEFGEAAHWFTEEQQERPDSPPSQRKDSSKDPEGVVTSESIETPIGRFRVWYPFPGGQASSGQPARTVEEMRENIRLAAERILGQQPAPGQAPGQAQEEPASPEPPAEEETREAPSQESVLPLGPGIRPPTVRERVEPEYSQEARIQGTVVVSAIVRRDGSAEVVGVSKGLDPGLDEAAVKAISQWKFNPGTKDGEPVDVRLDIEVNFTLR
jgi:TonB family protein